jgi:hypothetical protein
MIGLPVRFANESDRADGRMFGQRLARRFTRSRAPCSASRQPPRQISANAPPTGGSIPQACARRCSLPRRRAIFHVDSMNGVFHGVITPTGRSAGAA